MKEEIKKIIEEAINHLYSKQKTFLNYSIDVLVEKPKDASYGDYSTNIALALSKKLGKNPMEVANGIVAKMQHSNILENVGISKVEVAGLGFINFYLSREFFAENVKNILKLGEYFGRVKKPFFGAKKVIVEYTDPNPFKEFHIGHLMSNAIGEAISRLFEFQGAKVKRANYQGDVGLHVAKAIWGKRKAPHLDWANAYAYGSMQYEDGADSAKQEITQLNKKIFEKDESIRALYNSGREESLEYFEKIYQKLGTKFDYYFFESETGDIGKKVIEEGLEKNVFEKGEKGAIVFKGEKFGLHTRVFINSEGLPTYEAKELGLANIKYKKYKYDTSVIITGNEINEYFKVLLCAMTQMFPELAKKTKHIGHGMLRLPGGKMSSRTGNVIAAEFLIGQIKKRIKEKVGERDLDDADLEKIAIGAIKYSILKQSVGSDIIFDFKKSISFEGDSGPYLQYAHVRAISVLEKAKAENIPTNYEFKRITNIATTNLEKVMVYFPEVVARAGKEYQPHYIALYLTELAHEFNNYYTHNKIVDKEDEFSPYRVAITEAFSIIMKNGLWLLGIEAPSKM